MQLICLCLFSTCKFKGIVEVSAVCICPLTTASLPRRLARSLCICSCFVCCSNYLDIPSKKKQKHIRECSKPSCLICILLLQLWNLYVWRLASLVGKGIELDAVGCKFEPYLTAKYVCMLVEPFPNSCGHQSCNENQLFCVSIHIWW